MTRRLPGGTIVRVQGKPPLLLIVQEAAKGCRAGLSTSRTGNGFVASIFTVFAAGSIPTLLVAGKLLTVTVGVPLMPTFHDPLCCALTVGVFTTFTFCV